MKNKLLRNVALTAAISVALAVPAYAQSFKAVPVSAENIEIIPIRYEYGHWAEIYLEQLSGDYDIDEIFDGKDLDSPITTGDFANVVKVTLDENYDNIPDNANREAIVYELAKIWAEKTGQDLDNIPVIKMLIYSDTSDIEAKYNQGITVAYMKNIAKGKESRVFDPKTNVTYGELAALINNTVNAVADELKPEIQPIAKGRFETRGSYEIKDENVIFNFELMSHYTDTQDLMLGSGQQFELIITDEDGEEVYRYSDGKFFTMALVYKTLGPGESINWQDEWEMTNKDGEKLSSGNYKAEIKILVISEEDEKIEENQLSTVIEFSLNDDGSNDENNSQTEGLTENVN